MRFARRLFSNYLLLLILLMPLGYVLLPDHGDLLRPLSEGILKAVFGPLDGMPPSQWQLHSDSYAMGLLFVWSLVPVAMMTILLGTRRYPAALERWTPHIMRYYLALQLGRYGVSKLLCLQFPAPEANLLYTPFGMMDPDLLYWSTIGSSGSYQVFLGAVECIAAICLLVPALRFLGSAGALAVMLHVLAIDLSYEIDVVFFSALLLMIALALVWQEIRKRVRWSDGELHFRLASFPPLRSWNMLAHALLLSSIALECGALVTDSATSAADSHGIAQVEQRSFRFVDHAEYRRLFLHSDGYLILQDMEDEMHSHRVLIDHSASAIRFLESGEVMGFEATGGDGLVRVSGVLEGVEEEWVLVGIGPTPF